MGGSQTQTHRFQCRFEWVLHFKIDVTHGAADHDAVRSDVSSVSFMDLRDAEHVGGKLRVAAFPTLAAALVPSAIQSIAVDYPYLDVLIEEMKPADELAALGSWSTDIASANHAVYNITLIMLISRTSQRAFSSFEGELG